MARLKTRWNRKGRTRSYSETGSVLAVSMWKLVSESLINLENEGFETHTNMQRLEVIAEFLAYSLHLLDRLAHANLNDEQRKQLVGAVARRIVEIMRDNCADVGGDEDGDRKFVEMANRRSEEYADCNFDVGEGPGFSMRRILGGHVQRVMGEKDRKWIPDYVLDAEAPEIYRGLKRAARSLLR